MRGITTIIKALADENRLRAVMALRVGELCVCQLIALLKLAPSTVSKHMSILHQARLVESRKSGRWIYYRLPDENAKPEIREILRWVQASLAEKPEILRDRELLVEILSEMPENFCKSAAGKRGSRKSSP